MIAFGFRASISATGRVCGTISEYTPSSRTRRAISWAYCAPKSTTRTVSCRTVTFSEKSLEEGHDGDHEQRQQHEHDHDAHPCHGGGHAAAPHPAPTGGFVVVRHGL